MEEGWAWACIPEPRQAAAQSTDVIEPHWPFCQAGLRVLGIKPLSNVLYRQGCPFHPTARPSGGATHFLPG